MTSLAPPPTEHRHSPYECDYGTDRIECTVCGQVWILDLRRGWIRLTRRAGGVA